MDWHDVTYDIAWQRNKKAEAKKADGGEAAVYVERPPVSAGHLPALAEGHRRILNGVSGSVKRGEMVAILGASGAGKTTLLNALSARLEKNGTLHGTVHYKGKPRDPATWKRVVGYVEQDDLLIPCLTVRETLSYAARLRLPDALFSRKEKAARVDETISMLRLEKCQNTRMGGPGQRGVSGGERKRTSIGSELVSDVSLLLLDEPTSGLDAFAAWNVVENLREVSRERNLACLMTIHQPSWRMFNMFDRVILLTRGTTFFEGRPQDAGPWFESLGYTHPEGMNPADYFLDVSQNLEKTDEAEDRIEALLSSWRERVPGDVEKHTAAVEDERSEASKPELNGAATPTKSSHSFDLRKDEQQADAYKTWPSHWHKELFILFERTLIETLRNPVLLFGALGQTVVLLIIIGFAFFRLGHDQPDVIARIGILFFIPVNSSFAVLFPIINVFPLSRQIMRRERFTGLYRTSSFYISRVLVEIPSQILQRILFYVILYWMVGLRNSAAKFFIFLAVNQIQILCSIGMGFCIGAVSPTVEIGSIIAPAINVIFFLFGGNLLPSPPPWFVWLRWISPITYAYLALGQNEFRGETYNCNGQTNGGQCYRTGEDVMQQYNLQSFTIAESVGFLFAIFFAFTALGYVLLRFSAHPKFRFR